MARRDTSGASGSSDLESRVAALEEIVNYLKATQPHLMPQPPEPPAEPQSDDTADSVFDVGVGASTGTGGDQ